MALHRSKRSWGWSLPTFYLSLGFWGIDGCGNDVHGYGYVHAREYANDDDANATFQNLLLKMITERVIKIALSGIIKTNKTILDSTGKIYTKVQHLSSSKPLRHLIVVLVKELD